jgi:hypothetical protein
MKLELYDSDDLDGKEIREFLDKNNLFYHKNQTKDRKSYLKITRSHSICIINGFNELMLNQLLEDIKKYKPKII